LRLCAGNRHRAAKLAEDERSSTTIARCENRTAINKLVGERTRRYVAGELARSP
jgi:hypothetical protein